MDKLLIYISYDQYEYTNYFHLAVNANVAVEYCLEEKVDDLFEVIIEKESGEKSFELSVVRDENALEWDYLKAFWEHGVKIRSEISKEPEQLRPVMNVLFDGEYGLSGKDDASNKKLIEVLYSCNCVLKKDNFQTDETLKQVEEILNRGGEEMTELARIIKEKYERIDKHE